jgi:DNA glycosylase AlkZ-like
MGVEVLSRRALNRATLERQLLLQRAELPVLDAVEHLVGLQAQVPHNPYTALWARLDRFRPEELSGQLERRAVVRIGVMRGTIHLVTAGDCLLLRPLVQPVFEGQLWRHRELSPGVRGVDLEPVLAFGRSRLDERPRTGQELRALFAERFPRLDAAALVYACQMRLALVQPPPRGLWGRRAQVAWTTAEAWLGKPLDPSPSLDDVIVRYLVAFGPASIADAATWSRLTGLREVFERLKPRLVAFRDERGRAVFDLPDAPRPDADTPAPPRFLPEYDNVLLSHADRRRFVDQSDRAALGGAWQVGWGSVLHDGFLCGVWRRFDDGLVVRHVSLPKRAQNAVAAEGRRLLRFLGAEAREVRLLALSR